jgi:hypothetical protein
MEKGDPISLMGMSKMVLSVLLLCCVLVGAAVPGGKDGPTEIFKQWGSSNDNYRYYIPGTWLSGDICTVIPNRRAYLSKLSDRGVSCSGMWCNDGFGTNNRREDYEMEHIIDRNGMTSCPTDILGNLVMAYGRWNNQVGQLNPQGVSREKSEVYGSMYHLAYFNVGFCCIFSSISASPTLTIFLVTLSVAFVVVMCLVGYSQWKKTFQPPVADVSGTPINDTSIEMDSDCDSH